MQDKRQYVPTAVSFPGTAATFKVASPSENIRTMPGVAMQGHDDGGNLRRYEAQQRRGVPSAVEIGPVEESAGEIKGVSSRTGRLLAPPFGLFLRAALLAHLRRTFR